jgi:hypothetical protein
MAPLSPYRLVFSFIKMYHKIIPCLSSGLLRAAGRQGPMQAYPPAPSIRLYCFLDTLSRLSQDIAWICPGPRY